MSTLKPAFPTPINTQHGGMSHRDYIAAQCLPVILAELWRKAEERGLVYTDPVYLIGAAAAYEAADALIARGQRL